MLALAQAGVDRAARERTARARSRALLRSTACSSPQRVSSSSSSSGRSFQHDLATMLGHGAQVLQRVQRDAMRRKPAR